jgi:excisionase family DNA binding protein
MDDLLTSTEVARLAGVGPTAVKRWADAGVLKCVKTAGGHRRFERKEVDRFLRGAGALSGEDWQDWTDAALSESSVPALLSRLFHLRAELGSWHRAADRVGAFVDDLGRRWESGALTVVQEHIISHALQRALATIVETIPVPPSAPRVFLAAAEGDTHTLGLSLAELCAREAGWRSEWGGPHTRTTDVIERVTSGDVAMIALSASAQSGQAEALGGEVREVAAACREHNVELALGGAGKWPDDPSVGRRFHSFEPFYRFALETRGKVEGEG